MPQVRARQGRGAHEPIEELAEALRPSAERPSRETQPDVGGGICSSTREDPPVTGQHVAVEEEVESPVQAFHPFHVGPHADRVGFPMSRRHHRARERPPRAVGSHDDPGTKEQRLTVCSARFDCRRTVDLGAAKRTHPLPHLGARAPGGIDQEQIEISTRHHVRVTGSLAEGGDAGLDSVAPGAHDAVLVDGLVGEVHATVAQHPYAAAQPRCGGPTRRRTPCPAGTSRGRSPEHRCPRGPETWRRHTHQARHPR